MVERAGPGVGARAGHHVDRIEPAHGGVLGLGALGTVLVVVEAHRHDLALLNQLGGGDDVVFGCVVERADLVIGSPLAPVLVLLGVFFEDFVGDAHIAVWICHGNSSFLTRLGLY